MGVDGSGAGAGAGVGAGAGAGAGCEPPQPVKINRKQTTNVMNVTSLFIFDTMVVLAGGIVNMDSEISNICGDTTPVLPEPHHGTMRQKRNHNHSWERAIYGGELAYQSLRLLLRKWQS